MKKSIVSLVLLTLLTILIYSCNCEKGTGNVTTEQRSVAPFTGIEIDGNAKVTILQSDTAKVEITIDSNLLAFVETKIHGDMLQISTTECVKNITQFEIFISTPEFNKIEANGAVVISSKNIIKSEKLELVLNGAGEIKLDLDVQKLYTDITGAALIDLKGTVQEHDLNISGAGTLEAYNLSCKELDANISGSGNCKVTVTDDLDAKVSGSGYLYYKGEPKKAQTDVTGAGSIKAK